MTAPAAVTPERNPRFDVERVRSDFPALSQTVHGEPLVYLDNGATTMKPKGVIEAVERVYTRDAANVHRGVHLLSQRATDAYEGAREKVRGFLNARDSAECVFVRGTSEAINLVSQVYGRTHLGAGDEVLITGLEHHANIVPWQLVCEEKGARLVVAPINDAGEVELDALKAALSKRTKIVATAHASNTLGTVLPVREIARLAHSCGAIYVIDGAQAAAHLQIDVQDIGCDFYAFSGHKVFGPTGIGVLYGARALFENLPPYHGGGSMIQNVTFEKTTYKGLPDRFEAGTPHIAGAVGLGAAIDYVGALDRQALEAHEADLLEYGTSALLEVPGLRLIGTAKEKIGILSFVLEGVHPHDIGTILDTHGVAIRTGHHCTQPLMERFGVAATARASLAFYNRRADLDALVRALGKVKELFG